MTRLFLLVLFLGLVGVAGEMNTAEAKCGKCGRGRRHSVRVKVKVKVKVRHHGRRHFRHYGRRHFHGGARVRVFVGHAGYGFPRYYPRCYGFAGGFGGFGGFGGGFAAAGPGFAAAGGFGFGGFGGFGFGGAYASCGYRPVPYGIYGTRVGVGIGGFGGYGGFGGGFGGVNVGWGGPRGAGNVRVFF